MRKRNQTMQNQQPDVWEDDATYEYNVSANQSPYNDSETYDDYDEYDDYEDYAEDPLDEELDSEHNFHFAMNIFNLISTLVGFVVILLLAGILFTLLNWVQLDLTESLSVFMAPFTN